MKLLSLLILLLLASPAWGAKYYVRADGTAENKAAATGCGSASTAMSIATHNSETFAAGSIIYLCNEGGTYRGRFIPPSSGESGNVITYRNYPGQKVKIYPALRWTSGWSDEGGGVWSHADPGGLYDVFYAPTEGDYTTSVPMTPNTSTPTTPAAGEWGTNGGNVYVQITGGGDPSGLLELVYYGQAFYASGKNHIKITGDSLIENIEVAYGAYFFDGYGGAYFQGADGTGAITGITIDRLTAYWCDEPQAIVGIPTNCTIKNGYSRNAKATGATIANLGATDSSGNIIENMTTVDCGKGTSGAEAHISFHSTGGAFENGPIVRNCNISNTSGDVASHGIYFYMATDPVVSRNTITNLTAANKYAIYIPAFNYDLATIQGNKISNCTYGLLLGYIGSTVIDYNIFAGGANAVDGVIINGEPTSIKIWHNTFYGQFSHSQLWINQTPTTIDGIVNNIFTRATNLAVVLEAAGSTVTDFSPNVFYANHADQNIFVGGTGFIELPDGSINSNPLLNASYGLAGNSPAKDAGAVLYTYAAHPGDFIGAKVYGSAPDIGAYEYQDHTFGGWFFEMFIPTIFNLCASTNANCYTQP